MKKVVKLTESDIKGLVKKILREDNEERNSRYMFFQNLQQMRRQCDLLLDLDEEMLESILEDGHDWAQDHIAEAKNNLDQVFDFLMNETKKTGMELSMPIDDKDMMGEGRKKKKDTNPCWKGYEMVGMKMKNGKEVPNCVPIGKSKGISEGLQYHIGNKIPLTENVYRYGSESFFDLINEVRDLYHKNKITLSTLDKEVINSDVGKKGIYEGEVVYLDFPLTEEENKTVNSPKKSGSKNYVYVKGCLKDPKEIKKITYGHAMPDKLKDSERRAAYSARHGCEGLTLSKDKCTKKYWACRKPKDFAGVNAWW